MGKIKVTNCDDIEGLKVIEPTVFGDSRGYFMEMRLLLSVSCVYPFCSFYFCTVN